MELIGPKLIDAVDRAFSEPYKVQSDFARSNAAEVAEAASLGLITSLTVSGKPTREWRATRDGLDLLAAWYAE